MQWRSRARGSCNERGASAVEFALVLVPLLVIVFGLIQYGMYFYSSQSASNTVNSAARQLSVGNCDTAAELRALVNAGLGSASAGTVTLDRKYYDPGGVLLVDQTPSKAAIGGTVRLKVTFPAHDLKFPFVPFLDDPKVSREVVVRIEDTTDQGCPA